MPCPARRAGPSLCLAGLTRNGRDFHDLATALARPDRSGRDVYTLDSRGRGNSEHDRDWKNYTLLVEVNDALDFMTMKGLNDAAVVGTSRGGLLAMMMAVLRPTAIGAVVLNDIGPVVERDGLARIVAYVGRIPLPADWRTAAEIAHEMNQRQFTAVPDEQWAEIARAWFNERERSAGAWLRSQSRQGHLADGRADAGAVAAVRRAGAGAGARRSAAQNSDILSEKHSGRDARSASPAQHADRARPGPCPTAQGRPHHDAIAEFLARTDSEAAPAPLPVPALA